MGFIKGILSLLLLFIVFVSVLFVDFVYKTYSVSQREVKTDAIVVLAGGKGRIEEGIRLFRQGEGRLLFFIGVDPLVRKVELFRGGGSERVFLEKVSRNTLENALYARPLIAKHKVNSIKLITSRYHMKRATLIFRNALPKDVAIYAHPLDSVNLKEDWWLHRGSFKLLFSEFYKYCMFRVFFLLAPGELRPPPVPEIGAFTS